MLSLITRTDIRGYSFTIITLASPKSWKTPKMDHRQKMTTCPIELAHQMVYASIDYAAQFGFEPQSDWAQSQYLLQPRGELEEPYQLSFGKDGKPFFISGPYDNVEQIIKQLDKTAGSGNYDVVVNLF